MLCADVVIHQLAKSRSEPTNRNPCFFLSLCLIDYISFNRYYDAVVECDSIATADYLYRTCDGIEFERSSNKSDLRFIPDTIEFKHQPRDVVTEHSNIHLTWDEDEPQCSKTLKRKLNAEQLDELELKELLASNESEADDKFDENDAEDRSKGKEEKGKEIPDVDYDDLRFSSLFASSLFALDPTDPQFK
ncbi:pre-rRNA-processing ESF1, partial [Olea europaea subsp. europaea]